MLLQLFADHLARRAAYAWCVALKLQYQKAESVHRGVIHSLDASATR
eukprot:COSAG02_NODE_48615_length_332_cov_1.072961_1_plen_46_part_10